MSWHRLASCALTSAWAPTTSETPLPLYGFLHANQIGVGGRLRFEAWGTTSMTSAHTALPFRIRPMRVNPGQHTSLGQPMVESTHPFLVATAASGTGSWHYACDVIVSRTELSLTADINTMATARGLWSTTGHTSTTSTYHACAVPTTTSVSLDRDSLVYMEVTFSTPVTSLLGTFTPKYACISLIDSYHDQGVYDCLV